MGCLFGHDWKESVHYMWGSNVKTIERVCIRCGKRESKVEPASYSDGGYTVHKYKKKKR